MKNSIPRPRMAVFAILIAFLCLPALDFSPGARPSDVSARTMLAPRINTEKNLPPGYVNEEFVFDYIKDTIKRGKMPLLFFNTEVLPIKNGELPEEMALNFIEMMDSGCTVVFFSSHLDPATFHFRYIYPIRAALQTFSDEPLYNCSQLRKFFGATYNGIVRWYAPPKERVAYLSQAKIESTMPRFLKELQLVMEAAMEVFKAHPIYRMPENAYIEKSTDAHFNLIIPDMQIQPDNEQERKNYHLIDRDFKKIFGHSRTEAWVNALNTFCESCNAKAPTLISGMARITTDLCTYKKDAIDRDKKLTRADILYKRQEDWPMRAYSSTHLFEMLRSLLDTIDQVNKNKDKIKARVEELGAMPEDSWERQVLLPFWTPILEYMTIRKFNPENIVRAFAQLQHAANNYHPAFLGANVAIDSQGTMIFAFHGLHDKIRGRLNRNKAGGDSAIYYGNEFEDRHTDFCVKDTRIELMVNLGAPVELFHFPPKEADGRRFICDMKPNRKKKIMEHIARITRLIRGYSDKEAEVRSAA